MNELFNILSHKQFNKKKTKKKHTAIPQTYCILGCLVSHSHRQSSAQGQSKL